jgi:hypothetical protein
MGNDRVIPLPSQSAPVDPLSALLREKASELLQAAINAQGAELLARYAQGRDLNGKQAVVRNGYLPERMILTGLGPVAVKVPRAKDREELLALSDFPAGHWVHLRTSNGMELTLATIRHRTDRVKGALSRTSLLSMRFKLAICAEPSLRRLKGFHWLAEGIRGVKCVDGVREHPQLAAA